mgnify:CR=1 FL=1
MDGEAGESDRAEFYRNVEEPQVSEHILVTGGAGFIGSHLCEVLADDGAEIWVLDNFDDYYSPELKRRNIISVAARPNVHVIEGDVRDTVLLGGLFSDVAFDTVVHLAGRPGVAASIDAPETSYSMNVRATLRLLEAMNRHDLRRLVLASSFAVYGEDPSVSRTESACADRPVSVYGAGKRAAELLAHAHHTAHDLSAYCLRLATVYGPRQRPDQELQRIFRCAESAEKIRKIGKTRSACSYVYVEDVVRAIVLAAENLKEREGNVYEIINITGDERSSRARMLSHLASTLEVEWEVDGDGEHRLSHTPSDDAKAVLGFEPKIGISEGLRRSLEWMAETKRDGNDQDGPPSGPRPSSEPSSGKNTPNQSSPSSSSPCPPENEEFPR